MIRRSLCAVLFLAAVSAAAPTLTTIQDVLYKADGTPFNGTLTISWNSFQAADNSDIVTQTTTVQVISGNLRVQLVPSSTATPPIVYNVVYNSEGRIQFHESWSVPPSATTLRVRDVRIASTTSGGSTGSTGSTGSVGNLSGTPESSITGLVADLGVRPLKGPSYSAGHAAIVDSSGLLETVAGNSSDCVHVDGSSGPCGNPGTPTFVDGDSPTGIVDGNNKTFALTAAPAPASSLAVYRNGMLQKPSFDYNATGNSIQFLTASTPQPGDTLLASYRTADNTGAVTTTFSGYSTPQVLCTGAGATLSAGTLTSLGSCAIPAGLLAQGDRIDIRFDYAHSGSAGGFSIEADWGGTAIVHRDALAAETLVTGRADASVMASSAQLSSQTWGAALSFAANAAIAGDAYAAGLTITLMGSVANSSDTLTLTNFSVVRIP
ncbi:MAG TPA: hypothetical protein VHW24_12210 [Bryobacteraceae bacterium]|jgi:hypothetical protein|nr:hypothetical protein [Bryobacteraceae bacterium]